MRVSRTGVALSIALVCAAACAGINSQTNAYATLDEARQAGAVANGYVPGWLPPGSHDLREAHVPNTPSVWGLFNFPQDQAEALRAALVPDDVPLDGLQVDMPARIEWWPQELRGRLHGERLGIVGIKGYRSRQNGFMVAVNWNQGRGYYWSTR